MNLPNCICSQVRLCHLVEIDLFFSIMSQLFFFMFIVCILIWLLIFFLGIFSIDSIYYYSIKFKHRIYFWYPLGLGLGLYIIGISIHRKLNWALSGIKCSIQNVHHVCEKWLPLIIVIPLPGNVTRNLCWAKSDKKLTSFFLCFFITTWISYW